MSKMTKVGDQSRCPQCGGKARVVWVSQNGKKVAIRCIRSHSHGEMRAHTKGGSYYNYSYETKAKKRKPVKGMIFLIEATKNE